MYKVAEAEGAVAKLREKLASSEARVAKLEGIVEEQRRTSEDFKDQMSILVSKLLERDSNVGQSFETVEKRLNQHRFALNKAEDQVRLHTGGRGGITQGVSFEFFESFFLIYSHNTHWVNFEFFQKLLTTLIKTYPLGNF